jgi:hypothetical protein
MKNKLHIVSLLTVLLLVMLACNLPKPTPTPTMVSSTQPPAMVTSTLPPGTGTDWIKSSQGMDGGVIQAMALSPDYVTDHTMLAATSLAGIFKSSDSGST